MFILNRPNIIIVRRSGVVHRAGFYSSFRMVDIWAFLANRIPDILFFTDCGVFFHCLSYLLMDIHMSTAFWKST